MWNGDQNLNDHGFEFLSYIYGELDEAARNRFEEHLVGCDDCTFELAAYSDARLGMIEWRRGDFDHLESPAIVIPWVVQNEPAVQSEPAGVISRFIEALSSFPLFAQAGIGLAAAALAFGVFYFAVYSPSEQTKEVAANKRVETNPFVARDEKPNAQVEASTVAVNGATSPTDIRKVARQPERVRRQMAAVRVNGRRPLDHKSETASTNKAVNKSVPTLSTVDEEKDNSLRLSDLFAEIGSSEE
jgi:anti-sigma factor RsiW